MPTLIALLAGGAQAAVIWEIGPDDGLQDGDENATLNDTPIHNGLSLPVSGVQENGPTNTLPGNPANAGGAGATRSVDNDYYFEGVYSTVVDEGIHTLQLELSEPVSSSTSGPSLVLIPVCVFTSTFRQLSWHLTSSLIPLKFLTRVNLQ